MLNWSPLVKVTVPASVSVESDNWTGGTLAPTVIFPPAATVKLLGNS